MPKRRNGEIPLPEGWDMGRDFDGKAYYIDHQNKKTTWVDPRDSLTKPQSFADCIGDELPIGWEEAFDDKVGVYYIDHVGETTQVEDPREQWRHLQEQMLKEYLVTAQQDLEAKREIHDIKQQRLDLAQSEYQHLSTALSNLNQSRTSLCSNSSSGSTKYDPDLLKSEVSVAKNRVARLKRELQQICKEVAFKERGVETLAQVDAKLSSSNGAYSVSEITAIMDELRNIKRSLISGEKEKAELMMSLVKLKDDLVRMQRPSDAYAAGSDERLCDQALLERLSTASQTDLSGELMPLGTRLAEMARMRLSYDETRKRMANIQRQLADLEESVVPGQSESDKDRLLLIQEKEQLLRELRGLSSKSRSEGTDGSSIKEKIATLETDLKNAVEMSNRTIADRLKIHEHKQHLLQQLMDSIRETTSLESQLRSLSISTLSASSSSSIGSLSTASSKGSLSSLSFTDIYGMSQFELDQQPAVDIEDLRQRVDKLLRGSNTSLDSAHSALSSQSHIVITSVASSAADLRGEIRLCGSSAKMCLTVDGLGASDRSVPSLSPRSSLSSISPPISPFDFGPPPAYEFAIPTESQRRLADILKMNPLDDIKLTDRLAELTLIEHRNRTNADYASAFDYDLDAAPPLSPISELSPTLAVSYLDELPSKQLCASANHTGGSNTRSVSAAVSDESVAGDSGVYEAANKGGIESSGEMESAQIQIKLRYLISSCSLQIGIERVRNLAALGLSEEMNCGICIRGALLPSPPSLPLAFCTRCISEVRKPLFAETFSLSVAVSKLHAKTLQIHIWAVVERDSFQTEKCLGSAQISLADFIAETFTIKWYNILSNNAFFDDLLPPPPPVPPKPLPHLYRNDYPQQRNSPVERVRDGTGEKVDVRNVDCMPDSLTGSMISAISPTIYQLKEESSDESTIISSQTSTLTRNQGPGIFEEDETDAMSSCHGNRTCNSDDENLHTTTTSSGSDDEIDNDTLEYHPKLEEETIHNYFRNLSADQDRSFISCRAQESCDKETNTECAFILERALRRPRVALTGSGQECSAGGATSVKRSQTFSPSAVLKNQYICRLNRSDSDSAMPLYRKVPFQRNCVERRSLRWKKHLSTLSKSTLALAPGGSCDAGTTGALRTSMDLELDLRAQCQRLGQLQEELEHLREIKKQMETAKSKGHADLPDTLRDNDRLQHLFAQVSRSTAEEKRVDKLLKKTSREIYKLRRSRKHEQPDFNSFREKMAFFTSTNTTQVPSLPPNSQTNCHKQTLSLLRPPLNPDSESRSSKSADPNAVDRSVGVIV